MVGNMIIDTLALGPVTTLWICLNCLLTIFGKNFGMDLVCLPVRKDERLHFIYYASKTLDVAQTNYATTEKELLAVVFTIDKFCSYLV